jgi:hypothetical protein
MANLPALRSSIFAEQVHSETPNKLTILGYLGVSPDLILFIPSLPSSLDFVVIFQFQHAEDSGEVAIEMQVDGPKGNLLSRCSTPNPVRMTEGLNAALVLVFQQMPVPTPGRYTVSLYRNSEFQCNASFEARLQSS